MQGLWYGDRRDRVKWGALLHQARTEGISRIVQVAYFRQGADPIMQTPQGDVPILPAVWDHFSDLRQICRLGKAAVTDILVIDELFDPLTRRAYVASIVTQLKAVESPKIVFLDPDTGIEPETPGPEHVTRQDLRDIWAALMPGDILAIYQHADRTETWQEDRSRKMASSCDNTPVEVILGKGVASDVAMLFCRKPAIGARARERGPS